MKNLLLILLLLGTIGKISAQPVCTSGNFYDKEYYVEDISLNRSYPKYDTYGNYLGHFQRFNKANWRKSLGSKIVYCPTQYGWVAVRRTGPYYWFNWITYEKLVGYYQPSPVIIQHPVTISPSYRRIPIRRRIIRRHRVRRF